MATATQSGLAVPQRAFSAKARAFNLMVVIVPFVAITVAIVQLWNGLVGWTDLALLAFFYTFTLFGISIGFHRQLTHRSFESPRWVRGLLAVAGSMAVQGPPIVWVADHRKHHTFADEEGDPHSPHVSGGVLRGLFHAHIGWLIGRTEPSDPVRYARDLLKDPVILRISQLFPLFVVLTLALPAGLGFLLTGTASGALTGFLWGGLVRLFLAHHVTWSVNSLGHYAGRRRFQTSDHSTNVLALALPSLGESLHHNHHAFPRSANFGLRWWEPDPSALLVRGMEKAGLIWNVVEISPEAQRRKEIVT
ncbi:MAG TPA: acyl-CoA desaturase [Thermoleophilaceae bacterium]|jgi:stearoyl-CoA desaturase (delta-9 desaturase)